MKSIFVSRRSLTASFETASIPVRQRQLSFTLWSGTRWIADDFEDPYPTHPVRLCCEIHAPEDRLGTILAKCEQYHTWGVPYCWVIDPVNRPAWEYHSGEEPIRIAERLRAGEIAVTLDELFSGV